MLFLWVVYNRAMRRRSFLAAIAAAFVAPDPEKLLWVPGKKVISVPPPVTVPAPRKLKLYSRYELMDVTTHSSVYPWRTLVAVPTLDSSENARRSFCTIPNPPAPLLTRAVVRAMPAPSIIRDNVL